jgi:hypothetical protein
VPKGHDVQLLASSPSAVVDDVVLGREVAVRQAVVLHELPDILNWVEVGTFHRKRDDAVMSGTTSFLVISHPA